MQWLISVLQNEHPLFARNSNFRIARRHNQITRIHWTMSHWRWERYLYDHSSVKANHFVAEMESMYSSDRILGSESCVPKMKMKKVNLLPFFTNGRITRLPSILRLNEAMNCRESDKFDIHVACDVNWNVLIYWRGCIPMIRRIIWQSNSFRVLRLSKVQRSKITEIWYTGRAVLVLKVVVCAALLNDKC